MSGISGICNSKEQSQGDTSHLVQKMLDQIGHRGPLNGVYEIGGGAVLGIRHQDVAVPTRAFARDERTRLAVAIDGEIFNSPYHTASSLPNFSDAETILKLYIEYGDEFLEKIDGSYAIALWDARERRLLLARDRLGYKPLFYFRSGDTLLFASEIKSILASGCCPRRVNLRALNDFLSYGYMLNPETLCDAVFQVKPGHFIVFQDGMLSEKEYWRFKYRQPDPRRTEPEYKEEFIELLKSAVARRLNRHPDCGAFLSGGLDTSAVVAIMHNLLGSTFKVFTAGFEEEKFNETPDAKVVADHFGVEHLTITITFPPNLSELLEKIVWHHDAPFSDTSAIPSYFAAILAKEHTLAVLTGDFPDQLIGGSGHHVAALSRLQSDPMIYRLLRNRFLNRIMTRFPLAAGGTSLADRIKRMLYRETFPLEEQRILLNMPVPDLLKRCLYAPALWKLNASQNPLRIARSLYSEVKEFGLLDKLLYFDSLSYAPDDLMVKVERMTMARGLIAISPFHDRDLVEFIAGIPSELKIKGSSTKYIMREAVRPMLPEQTLLKKKKGFDMPLDDWLIKRSAGFVRDLLLDSRTLNRGYFDRRNMTEMVEAFLSMKTDYASGSSATIISLMTLELWHRMFIDRP